MRRIKILLLLLPVAACAGKPTTYLTLNPVPPAAADGAASAGRGTFAVSRVDIPPSIDRTHLVTATGPATLAVAGDTDWAGPLGVLTQIVLARDLAARLPKANVLMPGDPLPPDGVVQVEVNIQTFRPDAAGKVTLDADWSLIAAAGGARLAGGRFHTIVPGGPGGAAAAQSMSAALGQLADAIAHGV